MSYLNWCNAYVTIKQEDHHYKLIGEGFNRLTYDLFDGHVIKVPKIKKTEKAKKQSEKEYEIWTQAPESIKEHLVPVVRIIFNAVVMKKIEPIAESGSTKLITITPEIKKVMDYLEENYGLKPYELSFARNWGMVDNRYVLLDYGR